MNAGHAALLWTCRAAMTCVPAASIASAMHSIHLFIESGPERLGNQAFVKGMMQVVFACFLGVQYVTSHDRILFPGAIPAELLALQVSPSLYPHICSFIRNVRFARAGKGSHRC